VIRMAQKGLDVEKFKALLEEERARLIENARRLRRHASDSDQADEASELSDYDDHPADAATDTFEREKEMAINANLDYLLQKVDRALEKIEAGTYGLCDRCGGKIGRERLEALPHAVFCIECQDLVEGR